MHSPAPAPVWALLQVWCDVRQQVRGPRPSVFPPGRPAKLLPSGSSSHRCVASCLWKGSEATAPPRKGSAKVQSDEVHVWHVWQMVVQWNLYDSDAALSIYLILLWHLFFLWVFTAQKLAVIQHFPVPKTFCYLHGHTTEPPVIYYHNNFTQLYHTLPKAMALHHHHSNSIIVVP